MGNNTQTAQQWQLVDRIIQMVVLQNKEGDPDVAPLEIDVKKIVKQWVWPYMMIFLGPIHTERGRISICTILSLSDIGGDQCEWTLSFRDY